MRCCAEACQCVLSPVAHPRSRSVRPNRPSFAQQMTMGTALSFLLLFMRNRALDTVSCTFCATSSSKSAPSSRYSPVQLMSSATFADRAPPPRKQRPFFGDPRSHITRKNTGFRARECFHPWIHTLPNCYTSQLLDDGWFFHDDVIFPW